MNSESIKELETVIERMDEDNLHWRLVAVVEFKEVEQDGELFASVDGFMYEKQDDEYIQQNTGMLGDDFYGTIIYPISENKALKIDFEC